MEAFPPSYSDAVNRDPWVLVAPYVPFLDLRAACLVCRRWHRIFAAELWGNPTSHLSVSSKDGSYYSALQHFRQSLRLARPFVRDFTHTLDFTVLDSASYGSNSRWLLETLQRFPELQSLIVSKAPFFDHESLMALSAHASICHSVRSSLRPANQLRMLVASSCPNATSKGLVTILEALPNLVYLDLSATIGARDPAVLRTLSILPLLRVLKLRQLRLTEELISLMARHIGMKVRHLDLKGNPISAHGLATLRGLCLLVCGEDKIPTTARPNGTGPTDAPPSYRQLHRPLVEAESSSDTAVFRALTSRHVTRLQLEDNNFAGVSHLYLSTKDQKPENVLCNIAKTSVRYLDLDADFSENKTSSKCPVYAIPNVWHLRINHTFFSNNHGAVTKQSILDPPKYVASRADEQSEEVGIQDLISPWSIEERKVHALQEGGDRTIVSALFPNLRTLCLTGIPVVSRDKLIAKAVISIIKNCAIDSSLAKLQAQAQVQSIDFSSSFNQPVGLTEKAHKIFPLRKIFLEVSKAHQDPSEWKSLDSRGWSYRDDSRSVTQDTDSETLWSASSVDFSFFEDEKEKEDIDTEVGIHDKSTDVVSEIAAFRNHSRMVYEAQKYHKKRQSTQNDWWDGEIQVVRI